MCFTTSASGDARGCRPARGWRGEAYDLVRTRRL